MSNTTPKPMDCLLHWLPACALDVRGTGLFLVANSAGFTACANIIHISAHDGLVAVHETAEETLVQCTDVQWVASLAGMHASARIQPGQRDTGLDRFAQEPASTASAGAAGTAPSSPAAAPEAPPAGSSRVVSITSDWPEEIAAIQSADWRRDSLRGNRTLDDALEIAA